MSIRFADPRSTSVVWLTVMATTFCAGFTEKPVCAQIGTGDSVTSPVQGPTILPRQREGLSPSLDSAVATACYWVVSSRGLPQSVGNCGSGHLGYFERRPDGSLDRTSRDAMAGQLIPGVPICIFIHGSFVTAASHKRESAQTYDWIRRPAPHVPLQVLFYTWPSEARHNNLASLNSVAVNQRGYWAETNAFYLCDLIAHLPRECPICLVGHSHGARVAVAALHLIAGGRIAGRAYGGETGVGRRYNAVLAAGAFDRHWLNPGERYDFAVCQAERILNLVNRTDAALHFYHLSRPFARRAIGATGLTRWDRHRLGALGNKVIDSDVTRAVRLGHFWPNYYEQPMLADRIASYVYFDAVPGSEGIGRTTFVVRR